MAAKVTAETSYNKAASDSNTLNGPLLKFLTLMGKEWVFNLPSNNLWTVEIRLHNDGKGDDKTHEFKDLFANIIQANQTHDEQVGSLWKVESPNGEGSVAKEFGDGFIGKVYDKEIGIFLAQGVTYNTHKVQINTNIADQLLPYAGFMAWGMATNGKAAGQEANIQFLETNWNIGNILFDRWIAAILQQGLIESSDESMPNIKSDIYIRKYSPSVPDGREVKNANGEKQWVLREEVILYKAVPLSHDGDNRLDYETPTGPRVVTVNFNYLDYSIKYNT